MPKGFFHVSDDVCRVLGAAPEQVEKMDLSQFSELVFAKGYIARVRPFELCEEGQQGGLTIAMTHEAEAQII